MDLFSISKIQQLLLTSTVIAMLVQVITIYYFVDIGTFNMMYSIGYIIFSIFSSLFYYKLIL